MTTPSPRRPDRIPQGQRDAARGIGESRSFTCPRCGMTSYNPNDIREGYCGYCHDWTGDLRDR